MIVGEYIEKNSATSENSRQDTAVWWWFTLSQSSGNERVGTIDCLIPVLLGGGITLPPFGKSGEAKLTVKALQEGGLGLLASAIDYARRGGEASKRHA